MTDTNILNPAKSDRVIPKIAPRPPAPPTTEKVRELTASEALIKYFNDHEWDKSLHRKYLNRDINSEVE